MKRFDLWKLSLLNVFSVPVRAMLTVLGFAIGVAAILAVLTLGEAGRLQVQSEMGRLGIDKVWLTAADGESLRRGDGAMLRETTGTATAELAYLPLVVYTMHGEQEDTTVIGCAFDDLESVNIIGGRKPVPMEWNMDGQTALLGYQIAQRLNLSAGDMVQFAQNVFRISGVVGRSDSFSSVPMDEAVIIPLDTACLLTGGVIHEIQLSTPEGLSLEAAEVLALQSMERAGTTADAATMQVQMEAATSVMATFVNVLKWVAMVCILVGGVGVMNILLISVRERRREIGVMKSLGTTPAQICILFLLEALAYALIGGVLGIVLGIALIRVAGMSIDLAARVSLKDCMSVFVSALGIGLIFGVLPAFRASMLSCVDALRQE